MSSTRDVIALAKQHGGIFTSREAFDLGMSRSTLSRRVKEGVFVRLTRGVLALPGTSTRPDALLRGAGRILGAIVSHETAARMHGMSPVRKTMPTVTVPYRGTHRFPGLRVHQSTDLLPEHTVNIVHQKVTTPERTIIDLARTTPKKRLERLIDNALVEGIVELDKAIDLFLAISRRGKSGMRVLGTVLRERAEGSLVSATVLERELRKLLLEAGLADPTREFHAPWLESVRGRVDFAYVAEKIVIEADSRRWHGLFDDFETDRKRDIAAQLAGWIVLRITWKMIEEDPEFVVSSVRAALEMRSAVSGLR